MFSEKFHDPILHAAWVDYMDRRLAQIARIEDSQQRWDGYLVWKILFVLRLNEPEPNDSRE